MHNHNKSGGNNGMMWMMVFCFVLLGVLFLGGGKLSGSGYLGPVLIGVFVVAHVWMMFKGHGGHSEQETKNDKIENKQNNENSGHSH